MNFSIKNFRLWALGLISILGLNASAGIFDEDARKEVADLKKQIEQQNLDNDGRFTRLDEAIKNIGIVQLLNQIEALNSEIAKLRGQLEVLNNQNDQLQKRQKDFYLDLDTRIRKLEMPEPATDTTATDAPKSAPIGAPGPLPADTAALPLPGRQTSVTPVKDKEAETRSYDVGANLFKKNDFLPAIAAFQMFQKDFPGSGLVSNAQYWIGIAQFNLKDYANARKSQEALIKNYPDSTKVPDAMLAIASVLIETGDNGSSRNMLEDIIAKYPVSEAAMKARTRLAAKK